jgi:hypothetical protein
MRAQVRGDFSLHHIDSQLIGYKNYLAAQQVFSSSNLKLEHTGCAQDVDNS